VGRTRSGTLSRQVEFGLAELTPETDRPGCWVLSLDGRPMSHVDTESPGRLHFEYMRLIALIAASATPAGESLRVLHLGGGALSLPRFLAATRPASAQLVVERDAALTAFVRETLPLPKKTSIRVRQADAHQVIGELPAARFDLVIADVPLPPEPGQIARILDDGGVYAANLTDGGRAHITAVRETFTDACLMADPLVLRGRRSGNLVLGARKGTMLEPIRLSPAQPVRLLRGAELTSYA
jgi:spermidine synthase